MSDAEADARRFLDRVIEINDQYGMGGPPPSDTYERAVRDLVRWAERVRR